MHVLILGARAPACLEWARAFAQAGWQVSTADSLAWPLARASRSVDAYHRLPEPRSNPDAWIEAISQIVLKKSVDLVLPTCEEVFYLAHGQKKILCQVMTSEFELLHRLHHKGWFANMTQGWTVKTPESIILDSRAALLRFVETHWQTASASGKTQTHRHLLSDGNDWVLKPAYSRFAKQTLIRPTLSQCLKLQPTAQFPWVAQRFVSGKEYCSFSLLHHGQLQAHACYQPRYRVGRGSGIWFDPSTPEAVKQFVEQLGRETGYTGQIGFDFIEDETGQFHVLESNPRATSGIHLFDDQPLALVAALQGQQCVPSVTSTPRMVSLAMLLFASPSHMLNKNFWYDFKQARDVISIPGDRWLVATQAAGLAELVWRMMSKRCGLLAASTADIEWDGQAL